MMHRDMPKSELLEILQSQLVTRSLAGFCLHQRHGPSRFANGIRVRIRALASQLFEICRKAIAPRALP